MKTALLLLLITLSEATIGVFVKLTDGLIPIHTINFFVRVSVAAFPEQGIRDFELQGPYPLNDPDEWDPIQDLSSIVGREA